MRPRARRIYSRPRASVCRAASPRDCPSCSRVRDRESRRPAPRPEWAPERSSQLRKPPRLSFLLHRRRLLPQPAPMRWPLPRRPPKPNSPRCRRRRAIVRHAMRASRWVTRPTPRRRPCQRRPVLRQPPRPHQPRRSARTTGRRRWHNDRCRPGRCGPARLRRSGNLCRSSTGRVLRSRCPSRRQRRGRAPMRRLRCHVGQRLRPHAPHTCRRCHRIRPRLGLAPARRSRPVRRCSVTFRRRPPQVRRAGRCTVRRRRCRPRALPSGRRRRRWTMSRVRRSRRLHRARRQPHPELLPCRHAASRPTTSRSSMPRHLRLSRLRPAPPWPSRPWPLHLPLRRRDRPPPLVAPVRGPLRSRSASWSRTSRAP